MFWSIIREPADPIAKTRISMGSTQDGSGAYLVFRGDPNDVVKLLETAATEARAMIYQGDYQDKRGRPQG